MKKKLLCFLYGTIPNRYYGKKTRSISKVLSCALIQKETPVDCVLWFGCKRAKRSERHSCARSARPPHDCGVQIKPPQEHLHGVRALQLRYEQLFDEKGSFFHLRDGAAVPKRQQRAVCCMAVFCLQRQKRAGVWARRSSRSLPYSMGSTGRSARSGWVCAARCTTVSLPVPVADAPITSRYQA